MKSVNTSQGIKTQHGQNLGERIFQAGKMVTDTNRELLIEVGFDPGDYNVKACSAWGCYGICTGMLYYVCNECLTLCILYSCHVEVAEEMSLILPEVPRPKSKHWNVGVLQSTTEHSWGPNKMLPQERQGQQAAPPLSQGVGREITQEVAAGMFLPGLLFPGTRGAMWH